MSGSGGSEGDFESIYERAFPILMRMLVRMTGDSETADEICHEAFIRLFQRDRSFPQPEEAFYWLIRVAKNLALNHGKRRGREAQAYRRAMKAAPLAAESGEAAVLRDETARRVRAALGKLPAKLRDVLILKEYGDLSYRDIAAVLRISEGNVKVRVYRARERLGGMLRESEERDVPG